MKLFSLVALILFFNLSTSAQTGKMSGKIKILFADSLNFDKQLYGNDAQVLKGHVKFSHENIIMFCDEARFYNDSNIVVAKSNIHIIQNDTLHLYGDNLVYDGAVGIAKVRNNVKMVNKDVVLTTNYLDYDRVKGVGYYFNGGTTVNKSDTLKSSWGYYYPSTNEVQFKDSVVVTSAKYKMVSDTLKYHTISEVITIVGPTNIYSDKNRIYSELGYYDTKNDYAHLLKNSSIFSAEQTLSGDTIYYNRNSGLGEVYSNMAITDSTKSIVLKGNYGYYNEKSKDGLATKQAELLQIQDGDTLFLHADTLKLNTIGIENFRTIKAYHQVKFFRKDIQGRCDSMVYTSQDSCNTLYNDPVIWAMQNQLTAEVIRLFAHNGRFDRVEMNNLAFVISQEDTARYNQVVGQNMIGYINSNNKLYKIDVDGNGQTIYFPKDGADLIGVNKAECSSMTIYLDDQTIDKIIMRTTPKGTLQPPIILNSNDYKLKGFYWLDAYRPKSRSDIFIQLDLPKRVKGEKVDDFQLDDSFETEMPDSVE